MNRHRVTYFALIVVCICTVGLVIAAYLKSWSINVAERSSWVKADRRVRETFLDDSIPANEKYEMLFSYFVTGFLYYRANERAHAKYVGAPSSHGERIDAMEGFTRMLPLISAWISSGRDQSIKMLNGKTIDLVEVVKDGLIAGTDTKSLEYWGKIEDFDQRICEAADVALSIWLLRNSIWRQLAEAERLKIVNWLLQVNGREVTDNNWHLYPVLINTVLRSLGYGIFTPSVQQHYDRFKSFHRGNGWFGDGPREIYDYYNAWSIHYNLFWIHVIDPQFDHDFISVTSKEFLESYKYLISPAGIPIIGRSICYRMGAATPLVAGVVQAPGVVSPGVARRALDSTWKYFIENGALAKGNVTQGYCGEDLRFLDNYSGPASCLWSVRSLVVAFYYPSNTIFWKTLVERLPVEEDSYSVPIPAVRWKIEGFKERMEIRIVPTDNGTNDVREAQSYNIGRKLAGIVRGKPYRPNNNYVKYQLPYYSSKEPFCGCEAVNRAQ